MSRQYLGERFDIHTGGIDHREIHHPNEIAQNQAYSGTAETGATIWMHNNFLVQRDGKMSKSTGEFLTLPSLVDRGYHPLAYRLMCLQAHYRSELEFSWKNLSAALVRLRRLSLIMESLRKAAPSFSSWSQYRLRKHGKDQLLRQFDSSRVTLAVRDLDVAMSEDLNTVRALVILENFLKDDTISEAGRIVGAIAMDDVLGLNLMYLTRRSLRRKPRKPWYRRYTREVWINQRLAERQLARSNREYARSDAIRDELTAAGVEVMDGDPLGWDWKLPA